MTELTPCSVCGELHQEKNGRCLKHLPEPEPKVRKPVSRSSSDDSEEPLTRTSTGRSRSG